MKDAETINKAVYLLEDLIRTYGAPAQFAPQFLSDRIGGSPTSIGRVQGEIVGKLRYRGLNVLYANRKFCFEVPLSIPVAPDVQAACDIFDETEGAELVGQGVNLLAST